MTTIDSAQLREVLGNHPTGVSVITAIDSTGHPCGMAVGSFTSVSLGPALIGYFPDRASTSFPRIRTSSSFCVNILAAEQEWLCRTFSTPSDDKFRHVDWRPAPSGSPVLDGASAWIDCDLHSVIDTGDHYLVLGAVRTFAGRPDANPLIFHRRQYGRFVPHKSKVNSGKAASEQPADRDVSTIPRAEK